MGSRGGGNTSPFDSIFTRSNGGALYYDDERVRTSVADNSEMIAVAPGSYTLTEAVPNGWALQNIELYDPTNNSTSSLSGTNAVINVSAGEVVHVTFQDGLVSPVSFTNTCGPGSGFLETFGTVPAGTYGPPLTGQTSLHYIGNNTSAGNGFYKVIGTTRNGRFATAYTPNNLDEHTTGNAGDTGQMMVIDASYPPDEFYRRRLTGLVIGQSYNFRLHRQYHRGYLAECTVYYRRPYDNGTRSHYQQRANHVNVLAKIWPGFPGYLFLH